MTKMKRGRPASSSRGLAGRTAAAEAKDLSLCAFCNDRMLGQEVVALFKWRAVTCQHGALQAIAKCVLAC